MTYPTNYGSFREMLFQFSKLIVVQRKVSLKMIKVYVEDCPSSLLPSWGIILTVPCITSIFLKSKTHNSNLLASYSVKQTVDDSIGESPSLVFIHSNHLVPVVGHLREVQSFTEIHQVEDIFLETTTTKSFEEKQYTRSCN